LNEPRSSVLAITSNSVERYMLASGKSLESAAAAYNREIHAMKTDQSLSHTLFEQLLGAVPEYRQKRNVIVVPDGQLHLLPFAALTDDNGYVLATHGFSIVPSASVLTLLRKRARRGDPVQLEY